MEVTRVRITAAGEAAPVAMSVHSDADRTVKSTHNAAMTAFAKSWRRG
jgi:hypothetical protein